MVFLSMTKTEIKKLVKTCVETLARVKDIDLRVFDIRDDETFGDLIFDIRLEPNFGTRLYIDPDILKGNDDKVEFGKAVMRKIWGDVRGRLENDIDKQTRRMGMNKINIPSLERSGPIYIDPDSAYSKTDIDMTLDGYRLQQILKQRKDDFSGPKDHPRLRNDDGWNKYRVKEDWQKI